MIRNPFNLFVSIKDQFDDNELRIMKNHPGFPVDNVIQIKLSKSSFIDLFKDVSLDGSEISERYSSSRLLQRLDLFFNRRIYHNHNSLASDLTILINNTYNDIDINPVNLESACASGGQIYNYFFKSEARYNGTSVSREETTNENYGDASAFGESILVYEMMAREFDNMISRNVDSTSESYDTSYGLLDNEYSIHSNEFWENIRVGDSIFIEGSFMIPSKSPSLEVILQFVCADFDVYASQNIQTIQANLTVNAQYDISQYFL